jgi:hypothetical protein
VKLLTNENIQKEMPDNQPIVYRLKIINFSSLYQLIGQLSEQLVVRQRTASPLSVSYTNYKELAMITEQLSEIAHE